MIMLIYFFASTTLIKIHSMRYARVSLALVLRGGDHKRARVELLGEGIGGQQSRRARRGRERWGGERPGTYSAGPASFGWASSLPSRGTHLLSPVRPPPDRHPTASKHRKKAETPPFFPIYFGHHDPHLLSHPPGCLRRKTK